MPPLNEPEDPVYQQLTDSLLVEGFDPMGYRGLDLEGMTTFFNGLLNEPQRDDIQSHRIDLCGKLIMYGPCQVIVVSDNITNLMDDPHYIEMGRVEQSSDLFISTPRILEPDHFSQYDTIRHRRGYICIQGKEFKEGAYHGTFSTTFEGSEPTQTFGEGIRASWTLSKKSTDSLIRIEIDFSAETEIRFYLPKRLES